MESWIYGARFHIAMVLFSLRKRTIPPNSLSQSLSILTYSSYISFGLGPGK